MKRKQREGKQTSKQLKKNKVQFDERTIKALGTSIAEAINTANQESDAGGGGEDTQAEDDAPPPAQTGRNRTNRAL